MSFKFIAWADTKGGTGTLQSESKSIISNNLNPSLLIYSGDICSSGPSQSCFDSWKAAYNGGNNNGLFDKTFATRGNHDDSSSTWQSNFEFATVAAHIGATNYAVNQTDETFSFDFQNSHFVGIDNQCTNLEACANDISSANITWLDNDLTAAETSTSRGIKHTFLFWHGPAYPVDNHCCGGISSSMITVINKHHTIRAGFFGHEHLVTYTHLTSTELPGLTHEFEQFVTGGAGAGLYSIKSGRKVDYYLDQPGGITYGYNLVTVENDTSWKVDFYTSSGSLKKTFTFGPATTTYYKCNSSNVCESDPTCTATTSGCYADSSCNNTCVPATDHNICNQTTKKCEKKTGSGTNECPTIGETCITEKSCWIKSGDGTKCLLPGGTTGALIVGGSAIGLLLLFKILSDKRSDDY